MSSKKEYLVKMRWRYRRAQGRGYKSRLIEELMALCGYSRKHAIKLLNKSGPSRVLKRSGPKARYDARVREVLQRFWFEIDQLCGKRPKAALPDWRPHYGSEGASMATGGAAPSEAGVDQRGEH